MSDRPEQINAWALMASEPGYPEPAFGNPASTLLESGVGNCFPGLEFDVRQLDARFFPGLVFEFPGVTPAGPDGTQGARLAYVDSGDPMLGGAARWVSELNAVLSGDAGAALGDGAWYLHWVEQGGKRIELYDFDYYQNAVTRTPYEGETCWWIIRAIEPPSDPEVADLSIALSRRGPDGQPTGAPIVLKGQRRRYLDEDGVIDPVYRPGDMTASLCSPWTHDFRDCACQYWASNHPDVALGPVPTDRMGADGTDRSDPAQPVTFLDWMRRRDLPSTDVSAAPTIGGARPRRYDPYEINLRWEELSFVLEGEEMEQTPSELPGIPAGPFTNVVEVIGRLTDKLAPLELTLAFQYLYGYFSIRSPDEIGPEEAKRWPTLADDLRAARQAILSVALSEMTHLRWVNQILWMLDAHGSYPKGGQWKPVLTPSRGTPGQRDLGEGELDPGRQLRPATPEVLGEWERIERPSGDLDTEYAEIVAFLRDHPERYPPGLFEIAVRIDSDGLQHWQKFRAANQVLGRYRGDPPVYLRPIRTAEPEEVAPLLDMLDEIVRSLADGYSAERKRQHGKARDSLLAAREAMQRFSEGAEKLARDRGLGVPFFARFPDHG